MAGLIDGTCQVTKIRFTFFSPRARLLDGYVSETDKAPAHAAAQRFSRGFEHPPGIALHIYQRTQEFRSSHDQIRGLLFSFAPGRDHKRTKKKQLRPNHLPALPVGVCSPSFTSYPAAYGLHLTYLAQAVVPKPGITAWHVTSFETALLGTAEHLITGCGAPTDQLLKLPSCAAPRAPGSGGEQDTGSNTSKEGVPPPPPTSEKHLSHNFWCGLGARVHNDTGAGSYQSSCMCLNHRIQAGV